MKNLPIARDLMSHPVKRIPMTTTVADAAAFLLRSGISAVLVFDAHDRPVGVFSQRDLAEHVQAHFEEEVPALDPKSERARETGEGVPLRRGFHYERFDDTTVEDFMTPGLVSVEPSAPLREIVRTMTEKKVHRVFVEERGEIAGIITSMDILKWLDGRLKA